MPSSFPSQLHQELLDQWHGFCTLTHFSCVQLFASLWTVAHQASLSMGFSREEYWSGLPYPLPGDLLDPGIEARSPVTPALQADSLLLSRQGSPSRLMDTCPNLQPTTDLYAPP